MNLNSLFTRNGGDWQLVAVFGRAQLVRNLRGKVEIRGGSIEDHMAAKEWVSLFMHEAVPTVVGLEDAAASR